MQPPGLGHSPVRGARPCDSENQDPNASGNAGQRRGGDSSSDPRWRLASRGSAYSLRSPPRLRRMTRRSEEHTSELQSLMRISSAVFCLKKKIHDDTHKLENSLTQ